MTQLTTQDVIDLAKAGWTLGQLEKLMAQVNKNAPLNNQPQSAAPADPAVKPEPVKAPETPDKTVTRKNGAVYGFAPVVTAHKTLCAAEATHNARVTALMAAIPTITAHAEIFSRGKDSNKQLTGKNAFGIMVNIPFTYVHFADKTSAVKALGEKVFTTLKLMGYSFSAQKKDGGDSYGVWGTDSAGKPLRRYKGYRKMHAAAAVADD